MGWNHVEDADVLLDPTAPIIGRVDDGDEIPADDGTSVQVPICVPEPPTPSVTEVRRHNLTHINYRSWCPHCVGGRRPNQQHRSQSGPGRDIPLFCADYCFVRDNSDPDLETVFAGKLYPRRSVFATVCDSKGIDEPAINRLSTFLKESGISKLVYKTDQESAIKSMIDEALRRTGKSGVFESFEAVPEYSAVGESASNGRAERTVQSVEDMLKTLKSALEERMQQKLPTGHPVFRWLVEHTASLINRFHVNPDGRTAYQAQHGKRCSDKVVEVAETSFQTFSPMAAWDLPWCCEFE